MSVPPQKTTCQVAEEIGRRRLFLLARQLVLSLVPLTLSLSRSWRLGWLEATDHREEKPGVKRNHFSLALGRRFGSGLLNVLHFNS